MSSKNGNKKKRVKQYPNLLFLILILIPLLQLNLRRMINKVPQILLKQVVIPKVVAAIREPALSRVVRQRMTLRKTTGRKTENKFFK